MKFRVTIMETKSNDTGVAGALKSPLKQVAGVAKTIDTKSFISSLKQGSLPSIPSMGDQKGIILGSDEIVDIAFDISADRDQSTSNSEPNISVRISGKILSHIDSEKTDLSSPLSINSLVSSVVGGQLNNLTKGLKSGMKVLGDTFKNNLTSSITGLASSFGSKSLNLGNLYELNLKNTIEMANWAISYGEDQDYRDVVIEVIINENVSKTYILPDMFAVDYDESLGTYSGNGSFSLLLKQQRFSNRKIVIK